MANPFPSSSQPPGARLNVVAPGQDPPMHPWRRYFARLIDNLLIIAVSLPTYFMVCLVAGLMLGLILTMEGQDIDAVVDQVPDAAYNILYLVISGISMMIVEGFLLSSWGTTPGKRLMGLRVRTPDGQKLSWPDAMKRSLWVNGTMFGMSCIPLLGLIGSVVFMRWQRRRLLQSGYTSWDQAGRTVVEPVVEPVKGDR